MKSLLTCFGKREVSLPNDPIERFTRPRRRYPRRPSPAPGFVSVDGEAVTKCFLGKDYQEYVLLSVGERSLYNTDQTELTIEQIFDFLWWCFRDQPNAIYVGYFLTYDWTHWLKHLPAERAKYLFDPTAIALRTPLRTPNPTPWPVQWNGWDFDLLDKKRFKLRKTGTNRYMWICDAGSLFQTSFLNAIDPSRWQQPIVSETDYAVIAEGKAQRSTAIFDVSMIRYNQAENRAMAALMDVVRNGLGHMGITLDRRQWIGPGQIAGKWLAKTAIVIAEEWRDETPPDVQTAAASSYYGGRFEVFAHGPIPGTVYEYDINSAYPAIMASLPCLKPGHGKWYGVTPENYNVALIYLISDHLTTNDNIRMGYLPHRSHDGSVVSFPLYTTGWYLRSEVTSVPGVYRYGDRPYWVCQCDCLPPLRGIADLYDYRLAVGKDSPEGSAAKLIYNSVYGKIAQTVGNPRFSNPLYASMITSGVRQQIRQAVYSHPNPDSLVMIATDAVFFREPHPTLPISKKLGEWDCKEHQNLSILMPGLYWNDETRARLVAGESPKLKSRGINAGDLAAQIDAIDAMWSMWKPGKPCPFIDATVAFGFTSAKQAYARGKWHTAGAVQLGGTRHIDATPTKRERLYRDTDGVIRSWAPIWRGPSTPYSKLLSIYENRPEAIEDIDGEWDWKEILG